MHIPFIYVLFTGEIIALLLILCIAMGLYIYKKLLSKNNTQHAVENIIEQTENTIDISSSYTDYIELEIERNRGKINQLQTEQSTEPQPADEDNNQNSDETGDETADKILRARGNIDLLELRDSILSIEKKASSNADNEIIFWETLYKGFKATIKKLHTHEKEVIEKDSSKKSEKVFYIETQGKKVDTEVNKLKDIIYEQENILNGIRKSLSNVKENTADDDTRSNEELDQLMSQLEMFERQLNDSKTCMDVLELENTRLQEELNQLEHNYDELKKSSASATKPKEPIINPEEMKEVLAKQEAQIKELTNTINTLKLSQQQSDRIKATISDFARTSQEMMGCINILEEENERLLEQLASTTAEAAPDTELADKIQEKESRINELEETIIKKDVAYAKLQDEYSSIEKEYLATYEALHGENNN